MPAYWVARSKINDPVACKKYTDQVPDVLVQFGGKALAHHSDRDVCWILAGKKFRELASMRSLEDAPFRNARPAPDTTILDGGIL